MHHAEFMPSPLGRIARPGGGSKAGKTVIFNRVCVNVGSFAKRVSGVEDDAKLLSLDDINACRTHFDSGKSCAFIANFAIVAVDVNFEPFRCYLRFR